MGVGVGVGVGSGVGVSTGSVATLPGMIPFSTSGNLRYSTDHVTTAASSSSTIRIATSSRFCFRS